MENKQSFVLYLDMRGPLELLSDAERGRLFSAIFAYAETGEVPELAGAESMAFAFIRTALDRDATRWEAVREKRREAGRLGGKQSQANQASARFASGEEAEEAVTVPVPDPVPEAVPVGVPGRERGSAPAPERAGPGEKGTGSRAKRAAPFTPPSREEVEAYCRERGCSVDAGRFVDFYTAKGWTIGKQPMRDWRAAVRTWENREDGAKPRGVPRDEDYRRGWE